MSYNLAISHKYTNKYIITPRKLVNTLVITKNLSIIFALTFTYYNANIHIKGVDKYVN